ncbi:MAG: tRNA 2-thiocytidine biosynthesis TtcA family protein [Spirochaetes bacterium]|nr:tRNA 2-thiocytidine biosynthesis TtcA family protein [Spirochaetota bacterium]
MKNAETTLAKLIEIALRRYGMLEPGDRILVGVSGGKDSTCLLRDLAIKRTWWEVPFEVEACFIASDLYKMGVPRAEAVDDSWIRQKAAWWGVPYTRIDVPVIGRLKPGEKMSCYWCSTQRRTELSRYARSRGFNKLALGHHMDDILETLFMNMLRKGEFATMPPVMRYNNYPLSVIRPLALCEERQVIACAEELGFISQTCSCAFNLEGARRMTRSLIEGLTGGSSVAKRNLFASMSHVKKDYLA